MPMNAAMACLEQFHVAERDLPALSELDMDELPATAQELARLLGLPVALHLVEKMGGVTLRIPSGNKAQGRAILAELAKFVGEDGARTLSQQYAATQLYIPNCKLALQAARNAALVRDRDQLAAAGFSERDIVFCLAMRYGISDRYIWRILKKPLPSPAGALKASGTSQSAPRQSSLLG